MHGALSAVVLLRRNRINRPLQCRTIAPAFTAVIITEKSIEWISLLALLLAVVFGIIADNYSSKRPLTVPDDRVPALKKYTPAASLHLHFLL